MPKKSDQAKPQPRLIDNRNRIALTSEAMLALGVSTGDYVVLVVEEQGVRIMPVDWMPRLK
jgi:hypothetical protein